MHRVELQTRGPTKLFLSGLIDTTQNFPNFILSPYRASLCMNTAPALTAHQQPAGSWLSRAIGYQSNPGRESFQLASGAFQRQSLESRPVLAFHSISASSIHPQLFTLPCLPYLSSNFASGKERIAKREHILPSSTDISLHLQPLRILSTPVTFAASLQQIIHHGQTKRPAEIRR